MNKYEEALIYFCNGCHHEYEEGNYGQCKRVEGRCRHYKSLKEACDKAEKYDEKETILPLKTEMNEHNAIDELCPICNNSIQKWDKYCSKCGRRMRVV